MVNSENSVVQRYLKYIVVLVLCAVLVAVLAGCAKDDTVETENSVKETVKETKEQETDASTAGREQIYGAEDYKKIPDSMKDPKAFENVTDEELEYNKRLIEEARENVVVVEDKKA